MWQELPFASGKLSREEYERRRDTCTDNSVGSLASDPVFLSWLESKRQDLQARKQQARWRRGWITFVLTLVLVAVSGASVHYRYGLESLHMPATPHISRSSLPSAGSFHPARHLRSVSDYAQPLLDNAKPGPYLAAANRRLVPAYQQAASLLSAGIIQLPFLVPQAAQHEPVAPKRPTEYESVPSPMPPPASSSATLKSAFAPDAEGAGGSALAATARPSLLQRMGSFSPVKTMGRVPGYTAKSLANISKQALLALPSSQTPSKLIGKIPISVISERSSLGNAADGQDAADKAPAPIMQGAPGLLERMNRSSTSLAVYIARMPMRTAKTWGHITKQTLLALPAANYLSLYNPSAAESRPAQAVTEPVSETAPSARKSAMAQSKTAESAPGAGLLGRVNRSSKPLTKLISQLPARTSQGLTSLRRQPLLALPAAKSIINATAQNEPGAALPAPVDAAMAEPQAFAVASDDQSSNGTACLTTAGAGQAEGNNPSGAGQPSDASAGHGCLASDDSAQAIGAKPEWRRWTVLIVLWVFLMGLGWIVLAIAMTHIIKHYKMAQRDAESACRPIQLAPRGPSRKRCRPDFKLSPLGPEIAASSKPESTSCHTALKLGPVRPVQLAPYLLPIGDLRDPTQQPSPSAQGPAQVLSYPLQINEQSALSPTSAYAAMQGKDAQESIEKQAWKEGDAPSVCRLLAQIEPVRYMEVLADTGEGVATPVLCTTEEDLPITNVEDSQDVESAQIEAQIDDKISQLQPEATPASEADSEEEACPSIARLPSEMEASSDSCSESDASELDDYVIVSPLAEA